MKSYVTNPSFFRVKTLLSLEISEVDSLAREAVGSLTSFRLLLGRCLLAMRERKGFKKYGCSSEIHYSVCRLGLSEGVAGDCRRVARNLLGLPDLTLAAEQGTIEWGKLREVSRKASPETEGLWLKLCGDLNYKQIEKLVGKTPKGEVPGDVLEDDERATTEFRCRMSEEVLAMLDRARRMYSLEQDKAVTTVEVLEWALASYISSQLVDEESLEKVRLEMDKDLQAEKAREIPLVAHAREVAAEMGCIPIPRGSELESESVRSSESEHHDFARAGKPKGDDLARAEETCSGYGAAASSDSDPSNETFARAGKSGEHNLVRPEETCSGYGATASSDSDPSNETFARAGKPGEHNLVRAEETCSGYGATASSDSDPSNETFARAGEPGGHDLARAEEICSVYGAAASSDSDPSNETFARAGEPGGHDLARAEEICSVYGAAASNGSDPSNQSFARAGNSGSDSPKKDTAHGSCCGSQKQTHDCCQHTSNGLELAAARANSEYLEALKNTLSPIQNTKVCFNPRNRYATRAQKREVLRREGWCCAVPGCPHKIWLHLHHLIPYSHGGPTLPWNSLGICAGCHCNVHDGSLKIFLNDEGKLVFTDADGNCLAEQADLMLAGWLDFYEGWHGEREDSYKMRWGRGDWSVFEEAG